MSVFGVPFELHFQALAVGPPRSAPGPYYGDFSVTLRNTEPGHYKFYKIELHGSVLSTEWGKIGAAKPQSAVKALGSAAEALALANKTFRDKSKGGYVYHEGDAPGGAGGEAAPKRHADSRPEEEPAPKAPAVTKDVSPMLAHSYDGDFSKVRGWLVSEKYDGIRAVWSDGEFWTRTGNRVAVPPSLKQGLPTTSLDGELWLGFGNAAFNRVSGIVRSLNPSETAWEGVRYLVFDAPDEPGSLRARLAALREVLPAGRSRLVEYDTVTSEEALEAQLKAVEARGGEGLMLRDPNSPYVHGRSKYMLKVKSFEETEAVVMGYNWADGRGQRSLRARLRPGDSASEFGVTVSAAVQARPPPVGALITVKYFEMTSAGVPRFPSYKGERHDAGGAAAAAGPEEDEVIVID